MPSPQRGVLHGHPFFSLLFNANTTTMETNIQHLKEQLEQFHGSQQLFALPLCQTRYTEGIQFLATSANAFWLLTDASVMGKSLMSKSRFITIDFKRYTQAEAETHGYDAVIAYSDGNGGCGLPTGADIWERLRGRFFLAEHGPHPGRCPNFYMPIGTQIP